MDKHVILYFHSDCEFGEVNQALCNIIRLNKDDVSNLPQKIIDEVEFYPVELFFHSFNAGDISDEGRIAILTIDECKEIGIF